MRGTYEPGGGVSLTRCDGNILHTDGFFYEESLLLTYEQCYSTPEPSPSVPSAPSTLTTAVRSGPVVAVGASDEVVRNYAVITVDQFEGAYRFNVGTEGAPSYVYCTGRGKIIVGPLAALECRQNSCQDSTNDYVALDVPAVDDFCYHTCFDL